MKSTDAKGAAGVIIDVQDGRSDGDGLTALVQPQLPQLCRCKTTMRPIIAAGKTPIAHQVNTVTNRVFELGFDV